MRKPKHREFLYSVQGHVVIQASSTGNIFTFTKKRKRNQDVIQSFKNELMSWKKFFSTSHKDERDLWFFFHFRLAYMSSVFHWGTGGISAGEALEQLLK